MSMAATQTSTERRPSKWGKIFTNFKFSEPNKQQVVSTVEIRSNEPSPVSASEKTGSAVVVEPCVGATEPTLNARRPSTFAWVESFRRTSATPSDGSAGDRKASLAVPGANARKGSWWQSSNPDDEAAPYGSDSDRKTSVTSIGSSRSESLPSAAESRRPSYVPRNAASSFLKTVTSLDEREKLRASISAASESRRASTASVLFNMDSHSDRDSTGMLDSRRQSLINSETGTPSRRPSYTPRSAMSGFMRSTTSMDDHRRESLRHSFDATSASKKLEAADAERAAKTLMRRGSRDVLERHRLQSLVGICDISETVEEQPSPQPQTPRAMTIRTVPGAGDVVVAAENVDYFVMSPYAAEDEGGEAHTAHVPRSMSCV